MQNKTPAQKRSANVNPPFPYTPVPHPRLLLPQPCRLYHILCKENYVHQKLPRTDRLFANYFNIFVYLNLSRNPNGPENIFVVYKYRLSNVSRRQVVGFQKCPLVALAGRGEIAVMSPCIYSIIPCTYADDIWDIVAENSIKISLQSLLFVIALPQLILDIDGAEGLILNCWYFDDGILCGTTSALQKCVHMILQATLWSGLEVNLEVNLRNNILLKLNSFSNYIKKFHYPDMEAPRDDKLCQEYTKAKAVRNTDEGQASTYITVTPRSSGNTEGTASLLILRDVVHQNRRKSAWNYWTKWYSNDLEEATAIELTNNARRHQLLSIKHCDIGLRSLEQHSVGACMLRGCIYVLSGSNRCLRADIRSSLASYNDPIFAKNRRRLPQ